MNLLSILGNVASGGLLGLVGQVATGFLHCYQVTKEAQAQVLLIEAQKGAARETADAAAFVAAQNAEAAANSPQAAPWAQTVKEVWRPFLTLLLMILTTVIYFQSPAEERDFIAQSIVTATTGAVFFWFGSRYQNQLSAAAKK